MRSSHRCVRVFRLSDRGHLSLFFYDSAETRFLRCFILCLTERKNHHVKENSLSNQGNHVPRILRGRTQQTPHVRHRSSFNLIKGKIMSAKYILSELFLTAVGVLVIKIHCDVLWKMGTPLFYILAPIVGAFIIGMQVSRILHTFNSEESEE